MCVNDYTDVTIMQFDYHKFCETTKGKTAAHLHENVFLSFVQK